ncbi:MAG: T9SS type A sorting domain-containing protein [Flavobacteriales bacterium]|nr:T9SS type A sorting domain-containing protein [Flavobacteriales bacterium]
MKHTAFLILIILWSIRGFSQIPPYGDYAVQVDVVGNGFANTALIYFEDDGWNPPATTPTYGWDGCCDAQMLLGNVNQPHIYTEVVSPPLPPGNPPANSRLSINGLPHLFEPVDVPLGFLPGTLAQYDFKFTLLSTLPLGVVVELEDVTQNVTQDLLGDSIYSTWGAVSDDPARFIIHFYPSNVTSNEQNPNRTEREVEMFIRHDNIIFRGLNELGVVDFMMFDTQGRVVWSEKVFDRKNMMSLNRTTFSDGVYVLRFRLTGGSIITRKIHL